jgi:hypothetical protein
MAESMGYLANMAIHSAADFTSGTPVAMKYLTNSLQEKIPIEENDGIRCTRARNIADIALGNISVGGAITCNPTPIEWDRWLPYMGFSVSTNTWTLTEALSDLYIRTYMGGSGAELFTFLTRISSWTMTIEPGKKVVLALNLVGKTITITSSYTFPTIDDLSRPYMAYDLGSTTGMTIASVANYVEKIELACDHKIEPTFMTGQTATDLEPGDRVVTCKVTTKFNSAAEVALLTAQRAGTTVTGAFTLTNGNTSMAVSLGAMKASSMTPVVPGRGKIRQEIEFNCYKTGSTGEIVIVNDSSA